jgi:hypothetical protein
MKRLVLAGVVLLAMISTPVFATSNITIKFVGTCTDCAGQATATLVLKDFALNGTSQALVNQNLVSFTYDGSNLLAPYTSGAQSYLSGNLRDPASPDPALAGLAGTIVVSVGNLGGYELLFVAASHAEWSIIRTVGGAPEDYGTNSVFTMITGVPETASWALLIIGFGLIGGTMRGQRTNFRFV